jgi:hypothetical protein
MASTDHRLAALERLHDAMERRRIAELSPSACEEELERLDRVAARHFLRRMTDAQVEALAALRPELLALSDEELEALADQLHDCPWGLGCL